MNLAFNLLITKLLSWGSTANNLHQLREVNTENSGSETGNWFGPIFFIGILIVLLIIFIYPVISSKSWDKGLVPKRFKPTKENIFEIYVVSAALIAKKSTNKDKFNYISQLLKNRFPDQYYGFEESYRISIRTPIKIDSLTAWCNNHFNDDSKKDLLKFLLEITRQDNFSNANQNQVIHQLSEAMNISPESLEAESGFYLKS